jgi:cysteinyl-tRNA synthetase
MDMTTPIRIHNTLSGEKEIFKPIKKNKVAMYSCGPTVYDFAHIGNLRTFIMNDIVRRVFEYEGFKVKQAMNITDVDDKTIRRSSEEGVSLETLTNKYEALFWEDMASLNILKPQKILGARAHVEDMIKMIKILLKKGIAYRAADGIYVSIDKVKNYGALAHLKMEKADSEMSGDHSHGRIANDEYDKENPRDFAIWKFSDNTKGGSSSENISNIAWDAPFGRGRPGWHIECSAMAIKALGKTIDIHTGGSDLIFPHHTNEIAQSESATGKTFVNYWIHGGFMNVEDEKMSKSKGNFLKISDLVAEQISPIAFRYWLLTSHYRTQVNFSFEAVRAAQTALFKLCEDMVRWSEETNGANKKVQKKIKPNETYKKEFESAITDDFNMPQAVAIMWKAAKDTSLSSSKKKSTILDFDRVLGLRLADISTISDSPSIEAFKKGGKNGTQEIPLEITALAEARQAARLAKEWDKADALRGEIESRGYSVKDTDKGFLVSEI